MFIIKARFKRWVILPINSDVIILPKTHTTARNIYNLFFKARQTKIYHWGVKIRRNIFFYFLAQIKIIFYHRIKKDQKCNDWWIHRLYAISVILLLITFNILKKHFIMACLWTGVHHNRSNRHIFIKKSVMHNIRFEYKCCQPW